MIFKFLKFFFALISVKFNIFLLSGGFTLYVKQILLSFLSLARFQKSCLATVFDVV